MQQYKTCTVCGVNLPITSFYKNKLAKDGLLTRCKQCHKKVMADYNRRNPDKIRDMQKKWRDNNLEKARERTRRYRDRHRVKPKRIRFVYPPGTDAAERQRMSAARFEANNPGHARDRKRRWAKLNPEKSRFRVSKKNKRHLPSERKKILKKEAARILRGPCFYCGSTGPITLDHVIPRSRGGRHSFGNLLPACRPCNSSKKDKFIMEWKKVRGW
jgi:5-methylcytosine-specific restriction endonuclease McrA